MDLIAKFEFPKTKERNLYFNAQVDQESIGKLTQEIIEINELDEYLTKYYELHNLIYNRPPIKIWIDSYGGSVYQCFGLLSVMDNSKTPIHTIVTGCAMSCGFMILICGHRRFGHALSTPLYHQVSTGFWGKMKDMEEDYVETKRLQAKIEEITLSRTKITKKKLEKIYVRKIDWFMDADEAKKLGVIDEILKKE
jgi:ATP-dependent Clp protease protease subunit